MSDTPVTEQSHALAERAVAAMKTHGLPANPRAFEVWFAHLNGQTPTLSAAVERILAGKGTLAPSDIEALYDIYVGNDRFARQAERTGLGVLCEIDGVISMITSALGNNEKFGEALNSLSADLIGSADRNKVVEVVEALVKATKESSGANRMLEARLKETRNEINELRETLEATRAEALTDPLTGLANRRHFEEMLQKSIDQATLRREPFALVMVDIDFFKRFNDTHGHMTGDQVLRLVAKTMRDKFKSKAIISRFGGEEFAIILPEADIVAGRIGAETVRQNLLTRELIKRSTNENLGRITISLGVASYRRGDTASSIVERADQCLLMAKREGRNRTITEDVMVAQRDVA
ncbi:MAG: GGDEF domain-containing protein [Bosea sp. (in: a-proteobacteria)]